MAVATVVALAISGCELPLVGSEGEAEETRLRELIAETLTTNDPEQCTTVMTEEFLEQSWGERGTEAIEECRETNTDDEESFAEAIAIDELKIAGAEAEAVVTVTEGDYTGSVFTFELIHDQDRWKFAHVTGVELDRVALDRSIRESVIEEGGSEREADCTVARTRRAFTTEELERNIVKRSSEQWGEVAVLCLSEDRLRKLFAKGIRESAEREEDEIPREVVDCIIDRLNHTLSPAQFRAMLAAGEDGGSYLRARIAAAECGRAYREGRLGEFAAS